MIGTRISGGCCSHICSSSLFEKLMYSTERTEGSFCEENTAPGLSFPGHGLSLLSGEYLLSLNTGVQLLPFTRHITSTSQELSSIAEHCRVPPGWLVRQKCFNTLLQHWLHRDTWSSHAAGLTCLACEICAGPAWAGEAVCLSEWCSFSAATQTSLQLAFPAWRKETRSEPVKSQVCCLLQAEELTPMNWLSGAQLRPATVGLLKRGLA